jgi:prepilin-type processing-associated H-X9-DG protein
VIAILMVLIALVLPAVWGARERARAVVCLSNVRTLSASSLLYAFDHGGVLPYRYNPLLWSDALILGHYIPNDVELLCPSRVAKNPAATKTYMSYGYSDWLEWSGSGWCPKRIANVPAPPLTPCIADCDNYRFLRIGDWQVWFWPVSRHNSWGSVSWYESGYQSANRRHATARLSVGFADGHASQPMVEELLLNPYWGQIFQGCPR